MAIIPIVNVVLVRLQAAAKFGEEDSDKLRAFADVFADVHSQLDFLPGLGCLKYLTAIGPSVENLPHSLRSNWEKRVVQYAEKYDDAYPSFKDFAAMVQEQAQLKNHPNVMAAAQPSSPKPKGREHRQRLPETDAEPNRTVLKTGLDGKNDPKKKLKLGEDKYCYHQLNAKPSKNKR